MSSEHTVFYDTEIITAVCLSMCILYRNNKEGPSTMVYYYSFLTLLCTVVYFCNPLKRVVQIKLQNYTQCSLIILHLVILLRGSTVLCTDNREILLWGKTPRERHFQEKSNRRRITSCE